MAISADQRRALAQEVLRLLSAASPTNDPVAVVLMGGVAAGKTTIRRQKYSQGYVLIDAAEIFIHLCYGQDLDFPGPLEEQLDLVGGALAYKALSEKRPIVTEIIGDDPRSTTEFLESLKSIGYSIEIVGLTCDVESAIARNESRDIDNISAYYAAPYQMRWITSACKHLVAPPRSNTPPQSKEHTSTVTMAGQAVYEDADYILFKKHGLFGIRHPMLTSFYIHSKARSMAVKATGKEKMFLLATLGEMAKLGYSPNDTKQSSIFPEFCNAVLSRGGAHWHVFFDTTPQQLAADYVRA